MKRIICIFLLLIFVCCSCTQDKYEKYDFFAMNTFVSVICSDGEFSDLCEKTIFEVEEKFSRTIASSEISRLNNAEDFLPSGETLNVLKASLALAKNTDFAFNPCLGTLTELWNITSGENYVPDEAEIKTALEYCNGADVYIENEKIVMPEGMKIDLGGVAKGYALQKASEQMKIVAQEKSIAPDFCISLGGNVAVSGSSQNMKRQNKTGWNVGITNPFDKGTILGSVVIDEGFVSISGAYERYFEKDGQIYHHIFDAKTGRPAKTDIASAVVYSKDGLLADALSTALFVMGSEEAINFYNEKNYEFEMMLVTNEGKILLSHGFYEKFTADEYIKDSNGNLFVNNIWVV